MGSHNATLRSVQPQRQTVFKSTVYRIPALLYESESKTLLAFAEQRKTEADSSSELLVMKTGKLKEESHDKRTIQWSEFKPVEEARIEGHRPMNPCPVYEERSKTLFLFFICVEGNVEEWWQIKHCTNKARLCYITSGDLGQSWSEVTDLTDTLPEIKTWATFAVGPGHGLQTKAGRLIVPVYAHTSTTRSFQTNDSASYALALYSDDSGKKWQFGKMLQTKSNECEMAEVFDERNNSFIYCNARSQGGCRVEAVSKISGGDFSKLSSAVKLVETGKGCQGSVVSFPAQGEGADTDGDQSQNPNKWLLFTHPSSKRKRIDLGVYLNKSPQDPNAWSKAWIINRGPSGYSDLAYIGDGWFACLMECGEQKEIEQIASVVFSYSDVEQGKKNSLCGQLTQCLHQSLCCK